MLGERLYELRRKQGLSQEQLAEKIGVSRQTISKWEGNLSTPDLDKLIALADQFNVSLDELAHKDWADVKRDVSENESVKEHERTGKYGLILCGAGGVLLAMVGVLIVVFSDVSQQISESSVITIDGRGIALLLCAAMMVFGVLLVVKKK